MDFSLLKSNSQISIINQNFKKLYQKNFIDNLNSFIFNCEISAEKRLNDNLIFSRKRTQKNVNFFTYFKKWNSFSHVIINIGNILSISCFFLYSKQNKKIKYSRRYLFVFSFFFNIILNKRTHKYCTVLAVKKKVL